HYGTLKSEIERTWAKGEPVIFHIDVAGGINVKKIYPENSLSIFIMPPSVVELENRLRVRRTETEEKLQMRVEKAEKERIVAPKFDKIILNDDLEKSKKEILDLVLGFVKN